MQLILYFSAEKQRTAKVAKDLADHLSASLIEIKPEVPYSPADLRYLNPLARCNKEKLLKKDIPISDATKKQLKDWESLDWSGKKVHIFATSMTSGIGKTAEKLKPFLKGAEIVNARRVNTAAELTD